MEVPFALGPMSTGTIGSIFGCVQKSMSSGMTQVEERYRTSGAPEFVDTSKQAIYPEARAVTHEQATHNLVCIVDKPHTWHFLSRQQTSLIFLG